jgi:DNA-directed RNA polymerase specialized sigma24 family protein
VDKSKHQSRYEWLLQYRDLHDDIQYWQWRYRKVMSEAERQADGDLAKVRYNARSKGAHIQDEIDDCRNNLHACEQERDELLELVNTFEGIDNQILRMKYIEGKTLAEIADVLPYSEDTIRKKHAELHRRLDFLDHFNDVQLQMGQRQDFITLVDKKAEHDANFYQ